MPIAGHFSQIQVATGASAVYSQFDGIRDFSSDDNTDLLDTTDFAGTNIRSRMSGLRDFSISASGDFEPTDLATRHVRHCYDNGLPIAVQWTYTSTVSAASGGFLFLGRIGQFSLSVNVEGKVEVDFSVEADGVAPIPFGV